MPRPVTEGLKVRLREKKPWPVESLSPEGLEQQPRMFGLKGTLGALILPEPWQHQVGV